MEINGQDEIMSMDGASIIKASFESFYQKKKKREASFERISPKNKKQKKASFERILSSKT